MKFRISNIEKTNLIKNLNELLKISIFRVIYNIRVLI